MKKNINEYQLFVFDMDGTLYFQRPLQLHMAFLMLTSCLSSGSFKELYVILKFRKLRENWNKNFSNTKESQLDIEQYKFLSYQTNLSPAEIEMIIKKWIYQKPLSILNRYRDNTLTKIMEKIYLQKKHIVIYSDYPAEDKLNTLMLPPIPCFCSGQKEIACMKPNPKGLNVIMSLYHIGDPSKVLVIGDRKSKDGQAAINAGCDYIIMKKHKFQRKRQYQYII